jgi:hypothetical protein
MWFDVVDRTTGYFEYRFSQRSQHLSNVNVLIADHGPTAGPSLWALYSVAAYGDER